MVKMKIAGFCVGCFGFTLALGYYLFPLSAMSEDKYLKAQQPAEMEEFDLIDLGEDYGQLTIYDLIGFYMDNPPPEAIEGAAPKKKHFGGC